MGIIINVVADCQLRIRVDESGRITLKNRRSLGKCEIEADPPTSSDNDTCTAIEPSKEAMYISPRLCRQKFPYSVLEGSLFIFTPPSIGL